MHTIDVNAVFSRVPDILGLEDMHLRGKRWTGPYYINRDRHRKRHDKLSVWIWRGSVMVGEQGGEAMTIQRWLREYGGCASWSDVYAVLDDQRPMEFSCISCYRDAKDALYAEKSILALYKANDLQRCELYRWMCGIFGVDVVSGVWNRYCVTTDEYGNAVYWYQDSNGRICHDKVMRYLVDGHRDKTRGAWRRFRSKAGYTARCLFGSHLLGGYSGNVFVVESEKTALLCSCLWSDCLFLASGGKNTLGLLRDGWVLLPDVDGYDEWTGRGNVSEWFERWTHRGDRSDIGDLIELYANAGKLDVLRRDDVKNALLFNIKNNNGDEKDM